MTNEPTETDLSLVMAERHDEDRMVHHPDHYVAGGIEAIDVIQAKLTREQFIGYLLGNILKYHMRHNYKNKPLQDTRKAGWYTNLLAKVLGEETDGSDHNGDDEDSGERSTA